jgi:hypothetical protein
MKQVLCLLSISTLLAGCFGEPIPQSREEVKVQLKNLQEQAQEKLQNAQASAESVKESLTVLGENVTQGVDTAKTVLEGIGEAVLSVTGQSSACEKEGCENHN